MITSWKQAKKIDDKIEKSKSLKSAYNMTHEEVVKVVDPFLDISDFNDDGSDIETLRDILEGNQ